MKIGIEAQRIFRPNKHGMDIVALNLIRNLQELDTANEYTIFVRKDEDDQVLHETDNFRIVQIEGGIYPYWEQILLPLEIRKHDIEVLHCTSNTAPLEINIPIVVTLHDIIYLERLNLTKGTWYQIFGNLYRRWNVPSVVEQASHIITVSNYEKARIIEHFNLPPDKIRAIYNGVGDHFKPVTDAATLRKIKQKYKLPDKFVFFLGNTEPKKNMHGVIKALSHLKSLGRLDFKLVILDIDEGFLRNVAEEVGDPTLLDHIVQCGYVPNTELPGIYSLASLFLYPSLRESFGIPILEAMSCGVPVITSNTSSMPEIAGNAALLVDPFQPEQIAHSITRVLESKALSRELISRGLERMRAFSWKINARQTLEVYKEAVELELVVA